MKVESRPRTASKRGVKIEVSLPGNKRFQHFLVNLFESDPDRMTLMTELATFFNQYDQRVDEVIGNLKGQLEAERRLSRRLKNFKTEEIAERNKYENLFFECVEAVKREVQKRKNAASQSRLMTKKSESTLRKLSKPEGEADLIDLLKTKPEHFTLADKKKVLETFVINEEVLLHIYECLFVKTKTKVHDKMRRTHEHSFASNPLSSGGLPDYDHYEQPRYSAHNTDAFLTKVPGEEEEREIASGRLPEKQMSRFKTSLMP